MPKIVRFYETGGAEVLKIEESPLVEPGEGEVRLAVEAIGLNRAEVMFRNDQYLENPVLPRFLPHLQENPHQPVHKFVHNLSSSSIYPPRPLNS